MIALSSLAVHVLLQVVNWTRRCIWQSLCLRLSTGFLGDLGYP